MARGKAAFGDVAAVFVVRGVYRLAAIAVVYALVWG